MVQRLTEFLQCVEIFHVVLGLIGIVCYPAVQFSPALTNWQKYN